MVGRVDGIDAAFIYGSFAKGGADAASDIDVLVVGKPDQAQLATEVRHAEKILSKPVNYTVLTPQELQAKLKARAPFVTDIWTGKRIELIRNEPDPTAKDRPKAGKAIPGRRREKV
jgi:predicted nucleotidyltransferase